MPENTEQDRPAPSPPPPPPPPDSERQSNWRERLKKLPLDLIPIVVLFITVGLVILYANDWKLWDGQRSVEETNDAYVRADVTPLSTKVSGTVAEVFINDYYHVTKGQLLVQLRDDDFIARVNRTKSLYEQGLDSINTIKKQIEEQQQQIQNAGFQVSVSNEDFSRTTSSVAATEASLRASQASLEEARSQRKQATDKLEADKAVALRAQQERTRQETLFADQASTQQTIEQVVADANRTQADVAADQAEISRLDNLIDQRTAEVNGQRENLKAARAQNAQSHFEVSSRGSLLAAQQKQIEVLAAQLKEAESDTKAKLAAWKEAQVELDYTKIIAPTDGTLSERRVRAGQQVSAGTQVITIVASVPWVIASYRETQMRKVAVGDRAEVSVDALGGAVLKGKVEWLSPASEAQFALLPPDNPSGNFTKITQRLPIKIVFNPDQKDLARIKPGMTVIAKVWTRN
jgi:membrane fusion protein, multidrug efflux system